VSQPHLRIGPRLPAAGPTAGVIPYRGRTGAGCGQAGQRGETTPASPVTVSTACLNSYTLTAMESEREERLTVFPGLRELAERRRRGVIDELAAARREQGLSQTVVAARMRTSQSVVARLESGAIDVRLSTLERYAAAVGRDLDLRVRPADGSRP
jgi:ribosome-binding protein aMBF1 (putative translation factor)